MTLSVLTAWYCGTLFCACNWLQRHSVTTYHSSDSIFMWAIKYNNQQQKISLELYPFPGMSVVKHLCCMYDFLHGNTATQPRWPNSHMSASVKVMSSTGHVTHSLVPVSVSAAWMCHEAYVFVNRRFFCHTLYIVVFTYKPKLHVVCSSTRHQQWCASNLCDSLVVYNFLNRKWYIIFQIVLKVCWSENSVLGSMEGVQVGRSVSLASCPCSTTAVNNNSCCSSPASVHLDFTDQI